MISVSHSEYLTHLEMDKLAKLHCSLDDLPEALLAEIVKRLTSPSDLKSLSLVSKRLYAVEGQLRNSMYFGCGNPVTVALTRLCFRYPNLCKLEFNYSGWTSKHGMQLDDRGLEAISSCCPSLTDLTLSFCLDIDDSGLGYLKCFKKLMSLRLNTLPEITSSGLLSVAVGCKNLSALHLIRCKKVVGSEKWLEYLGTVGSLEELVVSCCVKISQFDLLKFGRGWMKLQKFEFHMKGIPNVFDPHDPSYVEHSQYRYDFSCESLEDLTLARVSTEMEIGLRCLLRKCKALKNLCLYYVLGVQDSDIVTLSNNCSNLTCISLLLKPEFNEGRVFRTSLTDDSLKALALRCRKLQSFELIFFGCDESWPEIGFTLEGLVFLIQSCPIRNLVLCGAHIFDDEGMKAVSCAQFLESLQLTDCINVTDAGLRLLAHCPCLINLTLRLCDRFSDAGVTEVARALKLVTLVVEGCSRVSPEAVQGAATSVCYKEGFPGFFNLVRIMTIRKDEAPLVENCSPWRAGF